MSSPNGASASSSAGANGQISVDASKPSLPSSDDHLHSPTHSPRRPRDPHRYHLHRPHGKKKRTLATDSNDAAAAIQPPPPALMDLLGPRDHVKFLLPFSDRPVGGDESAGEEDDEADSSNASKGSSSSSSSSESSSDVENGDGREFVLRTHGICCPSCRPTDIPLVAATPPPPNRLLTLISNIENADDAEMNALVLMDADTWKTLAAIPVIPELLTMTSDDPTHLRVVIAKSGVVGRQIVIEGWSSHVVLLQDLRLIVSQISDANAPSSASSSSSSSSPSSPPLLMQTRWMWLKKYATDEQYSTVRNLLKAEREKRERPVWGLFSTTAATASKTTAGSSDSTTPPLMRIAAVTYNVAGCTPPTSPLALPFLQHDSIRNTDMLVIGLQEMDQSSAAYVWFDSARQDGWVRVVLAGLNARSSSWQVVAVKQHVTILSIVLQRRQRGEAEHADEDENEDQDSPAPFTLDHISTASVGVGLGGVLANKGAVGIRMRVSSTTMKTSLHLCFVVAHLSAGTGQIAVERRIWDWTEICKRLRFNVQQSGENGSGGDQTFEWGIADHTHTILLGDLNSRLPLSLSSHSVQRLIRRGVAGLKILKDYDELRHHLTLSNGRDDKIRGLMAIDETALLIYQGWRGWKEREVVFAPTVSQRGRALTDTPWKVLC